MNARPTQIFFRESKTLFSGWQIRQESDQKILTDCELYSREMAGLDEIIVLLL